MKHIDSYSPSIRTPLMHVFIMLATLAAVFLPLKAQDEVARVLKVQGDVLIKRLAEADFTTALVQADYLYNGDAIRTGEDGFASLLFIDDLTQLKVKENSDLSLIESANARTVDLKYGTIRSVLEEPIKAFRVETPVSVASVKGTDFWLIHDEIAGVDRAYGLEGIVEIQNFISGIVQDLTPGMMFMSFANGMVTPPSAFRPEEIPVDPEEAEPQPEPQPEPESEEPGPEGEGEIDTGEVGTDTAPSVEPAPGPELGDLFIGEEEIIEEPVAPAIEEEPEPAQAGPGLGLGLGSVTIDGQVYYQIAVRPEFTFGKVGIGLDVVGYMDAQGNFRQDEWDEPSDYLDKILYLRYATEQDPFFFQIGAMPQLQYGFGALMANYSNMTEYPQVRRVGFEIGGSVSQNIRLKGFTADLKEFRTGGGLVGLRGTYQLSEAFPLTLGINVIGDLNQYGGLNDKDDDGVPDVLDAFPDSAAWAIDTDDDGRPDGREDELDVDGDGITDIIYPNDPHYPGYTGTDTLYLDDDILRDPEPFNKKTTSRSTFGISADLSYPLVSTEAFSLVAYTEFGMMNYGGTLYSVTGTDSASSGYGLVGPGLRAQIMKFLNLTVEYRSSSPFFQPGFFNTTYDFERAQFISSTATEAPDSVVTKDQVMINNPYALSGYFGGATLNLFNLVDFTAGYQKLMPAEADTTTKESNSFIANLSVNTDMIPKISEAVVYYVRNNDPNPFKFDEPSANTTWGYRMGYELGPGISLVYNFQESYRDLNGNGTIDSNEEKVRILSVETAFNF